MSYDEAWLRPDLLVAQTCGYPYTKRLRDRVRLVATPIYAHAGCNGPDMCSFIIVRKTAAATCLDDLRDLTAAINSRDSNSGFNLFRASVAPLARCGRFFSAVIETGSHGASIDAVASGRADAAAIECITFGNILRFDPERLRGIRILAETVKGPGLPFITAGDVPIELLLLLRNGLKAVIAEPALAKVRDALSLVGFAELPDENYDILLEYERAALSLDYPTLR